MPTIFNAQVRSQRTWAVAVALLLVYVVWGTTYFAIGDCAPEHATACS